jgi:hypothetical protein
MPRPKRNFTLIETAVESDGQRGAVSTRLMLGRYFAEIVADEDDSLFHWVVQRLGAPEILQLGQEASFSRALERTHYALEVLAGNEARKARAAWYEFGERKN